MDAARAAMGQGWPFAAGPRSNDGVREVERSETRMAGHSVFAYLFGVWKKWVAVRAKPYSQAIEKRRRSAIPQQKPKAPSPLAPALRPSPLQSSERFSGRSPASLYPLTPRKRERGTDRRPSTISAGLRGFRDFRSWSRSYRFGCLGSRL